jgi:UDP-GlcNAc3NAcA epimerase
MQPVGYLDMMMLVKHAAVVVTDSGGLQKEAFFCSVPCVTLRTETEWDELVRLGWNRLAPPIDVAVIVSALERAVSETPASVETNPYGDGHAAETIAHHLLCSGPFSPTGNIVQDMQKV